MRDGQSLLDQIISFSDQKVTAKDVQQILGVVDQDLYFQMTDAILTNDVTVGLTIVDDIFVNGYDLHEFAIGLLEHFRNLLIIKTNPSSLESINISPQYVERFKTTALKFETTDILKLMDISLKMEAETKKNVHSRSQLEIRVISMINLESNIALTKLLEVITQAPGAPIIPQSAPATSQMTKPEIPAPSTPEPQPLVVPVSQANVSLDQLWNQLVTTVTETRKMLASSLSTGQPVDYKNNKLTISLNDAHCQILMQSDNRSYIQECLKNLTGQTIQVEFTILKESSVQEVPAAEQKQDSAPPQSVESAVKAVPSTVKLSNQILEKNPGLKTILDVFDGEVVA